MIPGVLVPCLRCGEPSEERLCAEHRAERERERTERRPSFRDRGYDGAWDRLSRRARARQPFCSWPGCWSTENLTADHSARAWWRREHGLPIRLQDVEVLCREHNAALGESRRGSKRWAAWAATDPPELRRYVGHAR